MSMHPIMKQALEPFAPKSDAKADLLDLIETEIDDSMDIDWTSRVGAEHVYRALEREGFIAQRQALEQCQKALAMMIAPDAIRQTTTINAFEQCTAAELAARKALGIVNSPPPHSQD